jgi:hypothetical protein
MMKKKERDHRAIPDLNEPFKRIMISSADQRWPVFLIIIPLFILPLPNRTDTINHGKTLKY